MIGTMLMGRLVRPFAALALALLAQPSLATINCEIFPNGSTSLTASTGDNLSLGYTISGSGCPTVVASTTTLITDTTGGNVPVASEMAAPGARASSVNVGAAAGTMVVRVQCAPDCFGGTTSIDYTITASVAVSRNLSAADPVSFSIETGSTRTISVRADDSGTPASTTILWSTGGPVSVSPTSSNTDAGGFATVTATFGPGTGTATITATRVDNTAFPVSFTANVLPPTVRTLAAVSGNNQTGPTRTPVANPLVVEARDNGLPVSGIGLAWRVVSGDATITSAGTSTGPTGQAQAAIAFGPTPGPVVVRATRSDNPAAAVDFTLTSTLTRALATVSGNSQTAQTRTPLPAPLVVEARDNGIIAPGIDVLWSVVSGDAALAGAQARTDVAGRAQTGLQLGATPGPIVVRATRSDDRSASVDFSVTSTFTRTITLVSGGNQQGLPGLPLPEPIVVEVRGNGVPEAGIAVDISVQGDATVSDERGATSKLVKLTGADGRVSAIITLGADSAGVVNIQASVPGSPGVSTTIAATSGGLDDLPGLPEPLRELGGVIQTACAEIARLPSGQRTAEQADLLARCQSFAGANPEQIALALDQLLPDTTLAMVSVALLSGQAQLDNVRGRLAAIRSGAPGGGLDGLALAAPTGRIPLLGLAGSILGAQEDGSAEAGAGFDRWGYFVSGTIGRGETEEGRRTPAFDFDISGLTAGVDYRFSDQFLGGASIGYTRQDTDLAGGGTVAADGFSLSAYATMYRDQSWYTDAVATWGRNDYDTARRIRYTLTNAAGSATVDQTARGQIDGDLLSLATTVGRDYQAGSWSIGPYGRLLYTRIDFDAGREIIGGGVGSGFALEIFPGTHTSLASVAGAKFSRAISRDWGILMPQLQVEWEREFRDDPQRVGARFLADPSARRFEIEGDRLDSSFFRIGGGLSALFAGGRSGFLYVERVVGRSGFSQTNVALGIRGEF